MMKNKLKLVLITFIFALGGYYYLYYHQQNTQKPNTQTVKKTDNQEIPSLTLSQRIEKRSLAIKESQKKHQIKEKEFIDRQKSQKKPIVYKDLSLKDDTDNTKQYDKQHDEDRIQVIVEELKRPFFENPDHEDLSGSIRRRLANREWLEENLQNTNKEEKQNFIKQFVQIAKEQGYKVHFPKTGWNVILEPIDTSKQNSSKEKVLSKEELETPIVRWH